MKIQIINGPNLNLLGTRQPEIYGSVTFDAFFKELKKAFPGIGLFSYQSNIEGELINKVHEISTQDFQYIILNAGGYTHTSVALADALAAVQIPTLEVHISNVLAREEFRHKSLIAPRCIGSIVGFGLNSYHLAVQACVLRHSAHKS